MDLKVFAQGSYKSNTNIKLDSDVDINVCCLNFLFTEYQDGILAEEVGISNSNFTFNEYKELIGQALYSRFGLSGVTRKEKSYVVHANTYRIKADVVPSFEFRQYFRSYDLSYTYRAGIRFISDDGNIITNFPHQTYENGVVKNKATSRRYKQVIRIVKGLRNEMQESGYLAANNIPSFLIESIMWNIPNHFYDGQDLFAIVENCITQAWFNTNYEDRCKNWREVNDIKYLFHPTQPWKREKVNDFLWDLLRFIKE